MDIPEKLAKTITARWGDKAQQWLDNLPKLLQKCEERFGITIGDPLENCSFNLVAHAQKKNGENVVIKVGYPESEIAHEWKTLQAFNGKDMVELLDLDTDLHAMLLERIDPGHELVATGNDEEETRIVAEIVKNLPIEISSVEKDVFTTAADWIKAIDTIGTDHSLPLEKLQKAKELFYYLDRTTTKKMLLHGDLHHYNIIFDEKKGWISVDPLGVVAEPIFETAQFFLNPYDLTERKNIPAILKKRGEIFADVLGADIKRIFQWAYVKAVISACWSVEDNDDSWKGTMQIADVLESFL